MRLYFDLDSGKLVQGVGLTSPLSAIALKRGDAVKLELSFCRGNDAVALVGDPVEMIFAVKQTPAASSGILMLANDWTFDANDDVWSAALPSDTSALNTMIGNNPYLDLLGEFTYTETTGGPTTSQTIKVRVSNDLWKGNEGTPLELQTPVQWLAEHVIDALGYTPATGVQGEKADQALPFLMMQNTSIVFKGTTPALRPCVFAGYCPGDEICALYSNDGKNSYGTDPNRTVLTKAGGGTRWYIWHTDESGTVTYYAWIDSISDIPFGLSGWTVETGSGQPEIYPANTVVVPTYASDSAARGDGKTTGSLYFDGTEFRSVQP